MPGFDGSGPLGQGPLTGRGMGYCAVPLDEVNANIDCISDTVKKQSFLQRFYSQFRSGYFYTPGYPGVPVMSDFCRKRILRGRNLTGRMGRRFGGKR